MSIERRPGPFPLAMSERAVPGGVGAEGHATPTPLSIIFLEGICRSMVAFAHRFQLR